LITIDRIVIL